ncbi:hypothetical protein BGY98DRAFT_928640, partial [Russula aff. rugulosa BPL654]
VSALRCGAQLIVVTFVLRCVFNVGSMWAVARLARRFLHIVARASGTLTIPVLLNALYGFEIFAVVFTTMLVSTIPVSIIGAYFAMGIDPFQSPEQYLPLMCMLCENATSGISVSLSYVLSKLECVRKPHRAPGTSHLEDPHLLVVEGLRLGLMPTINRMSLMGATVIPSMMLRTILGGTDIEQAAKLQIIITFMMAASTTLSCIIAVYFGLWICVDSEQHIRSNCIDTSPHVVRRAFNSVILVIINIVGYIWNLTMICVKHFLQRRARVDNTASPSEHGALLNGSGSGDMMPGFCLSRQCCSCRSLTGSCR